MDSLGKVAEALGHSERTLQTNHKALVTREQAKAFWALTPKAVANNGGEPARRHGPAHSPRT